MSETGDPPIVVSGGSVTVEFDKKQLAEDADGKHHHPHKKIDRIEIAGGDLKFTGDAKSGFTGTTDSGKITVKIFYGDDK